MNQIISFFTFPPYKILHNETFVCIIIILCSFSTSILSKTLFNIYSKRGNGTENKICY